LYIDEGEGVRMTLLKLKETDLHWREIDGEIIALETRGSRYVAANGAGTVLWRALVRGTTRDGLADELVREYGIDRGRAAADAARFVAALAEQGLLDVRGA
jgi:Coenzyme PQQ synthesis protein D (PqqD)